jgi:transcription elongation factor GreA
LSQIIFSPPDEPVGLFYQKIMTKNQLTKEGHEQLVAELANLNDHADKLIAKIEEVAQPDESGEDSLASQLKAELEVVNSKIASIEEVLENFEIITGKLSTNTVQVGSQVKIKVSGNSERVFHLVGEFEADPSANKISVQSPLGLALVGKKLHDQFEVEAPAGKLTYKIVAIA